MSEKRKSFFKKMGRGLAAEIILFCAVFLFMGIFLFTVLSTLYLILFVILAIAFIGYRIYSRSRKRADP